LPIADWQQATGPCKNDTRNWQIDNRQSTIGNIKDCQLPIGSKRRALVKTILEIGKSTIDNRQSTIGNIKDCQLPIGSKRRGLVKKRQSKLANR
jgi:hypothetical protein